MIKLSHVYKSFDREKTFVIKDISLEIREGETLVLLGSSGCGKTTLLKLINRLLKPTRGDIEINGQNICTLDPVKLRRSVGYVFQQVGLFPHMTVEENISIVLRLNKISYSERIKRAHELLELVKLKPTIFAKRFPHELSGGQSQRVGVARSLAANPKLLLMDEPFGALDAINRDSLQNELIELKTNLQKTIIFVTHDIFEALKLGDRIAVMNHGIIEQVDSTDKILNHPATPFVKSLFAKPRDQLTQFSNQQSGYQ